MAAGETEIARNFDSELARISQAKIAAREAEQRERMFPPFKRRHGPRLHSFDARNAKGSDMSHESRLLDFAMESIKRTFARRATTSLLSDRDGLLPLASEPSHPLTTWNSSLG